VKLLDLIAIGTVFIFITALIARLAVYLHSIDTHFTLLVAYYAASVLVIIYTIYVILEMRKLP
jgi:hypothetical protein